jgi:cytochrome P450 family 6
LHVTRTYSELLYFNKKLYSSFSEIDGDLFVAQALSFVLTGYETSGTTLSFALYELALHPEIQQSLRAEILQVLSKHGGKLTYDGIQDMLYLDRVVSGEIREQDKQ